MTKRPDQHNLDHNEGGATDYKFRRKSEDGVDRSMAEDQPVAPGPAETPNEALEAIRRQSQSGREEELGRARRGQEARRKSEGGDRDADAT